MNNWYSQNWVLELKLGSVITLFLLHIFIWEEIVKQLILQIFLRFHLPLFKWDGVLSVVDQNTMLSPSFFQIKLWNVLLVNLNSLSRIVSFQTLTYWISKEETQHEESLRAYLSASLMLPATIMSHYFFLSVKNWHI